MKKIRQLQAVLAKLTPLVANLTITNEMRAKEEIWEEAFSPAAATALITKKLNIIAAVLAQPARAQEHVTVYEFCELLSLLQRLQNLLEKADPAFVHFMPQLIEKSRPFVLCPPPSDD